MTSYLLKRQEIVGLRSSRLDQVLAKANAGKVTQPDRRHRQDRHRDRDLGQDRGPDRRVTPLQPSLSHELIGQLRDPRPDLVRQHASDQGEVLRGHSVFAVLFEREPSVSEPPEGIFIKPPIVCARATNRQLRLMV